METKHQCKSMELTSLQRPCPSFFRQSRSCQGRVLRAPNAEGVEKLGLMILHPSLHALARSMTRPRRSCCRRTTTSRTFGKPLADLSFHALLFRLILLGIHKLASQRKQVLPDGLCKIYRSLYSITGNRERHVAANLMDSSRG